VSNSSQNTTRVLVVIPARYESSRFPGKAMADLAGEPLIVRVVRNAAWMQLADELIVATDDERIRLAVVEAGFQCELTRNHPTGTDRIGEIAARHGADLIVNLQGDEPLLDPADADRLVQAMLDDPQADIGTCAHAFAEEEAWHDPNTVKVLVDRSDRALYFSRAPVPGCFPGGETAGHRSAMRHVGIYAFRRRALEKFLDLERTPLEIQEGLEQLRALEHGMNIRVLTIDRAPVGVDTPADLEEVRKLWRQRYGAC